MSNKRKVPKSLEQAKINLFSREGLRKMFPTASRIVRSKGRWTVYFDAPPNYSIKGISIKQLEL